MTASDPPLFAIAGPTAAGKSAAAMTLAARLPVEIVSVDSALIYRGMDIGTAKPSADERRAVPHHLIDIVDPAERYSAARFVDDARAAIAAIRARGRVPLLVGGTMLYLKALRDGLDDMPTIDPSLRVAIAREAAAAGWPAMHARLADVDAATASRLAPNDAQRISRALEVWRGAGVALSSLQRARTATAGSALRLVSLEPADRGELHRRIAARFDAMLAAGLVDEVKTLYDRQDLDADLPSMRCVGYRQVREWLAGRGDEATMRERGIAATRQLAKRQVTWLRSMPDRTAIDAFAPDAAARVVERVVRWVGEAGG